MDILAITAGAFIVLVIIAITKFITLVAPQVTGALTIIVAIVVGILVSLLAGVLGLEHITIAQGIAYGLAGVGLHTTAAAVNTNATIVK